MATEITLPRLGQGMESGVIVRWLKQEGDSVSKGEPLYELDTDKVTQEVEAEVDGVLQKIVVSEGEVEVGATIAIVETNGDVPAGARDAPESGAEAEPVEAAEVEPASRSGTEAAEQASAVEPAAEAGASGEAPQAPPDAPRDGARLKASPLARRIARERGVDLASVSGTGPEGRILAEDVERAPVGGAPAPAEAPDGAPRPPAGEAEVVRLSSVRKTIARRLSEAWTAPVFQLGVRGRRTVLEVVDLSSPFVRAAKRGSLHQKVAGDVDLDDEI